MSSRRTSLNKPTSISGKRGKSPPTLDYASRPHIGARSASHSTSMHAGRGGLVNMQDFQPSDQSSFSARTNWNVDDGTLRPLPSLHPPLDPSSSAFVGDASPSVIAARVSDCLRERSIMSEFDDDSATASAMTANRVRFMIRLYRGGAPTTPFAHGVIVDIQRLRGDPITFHQSSRAILSAAQGDSNSARLYNNVLPNHGMGLALDTPFNGTPVARGRLKQDDSEVLSAIEIDWSLIKKDRMDANILGWESLSLLTSEQGSGRTTALIAGRVVLGLAPSGNEEDEGEDERHAEIHAAIISLVRDRRMLGGDAVYDIDSSFNNEGKNDADYLTAEELAAAPFQHPASFPEDSEHITVQRSLAIRSLANALEIVANAGDVRFLERALPHLVNENIVPSLLDEVAQSVLPNNPFNASDATHAARALRIIFEHSQDARNIAHARNALNVLSKATTVGRSRHAALEQEAGRAFQVLNGGGLSPPPGVDLSSP